MGALLLVQSRTFKMKQGAIVKNRSSSIRVVSVAVASGLLVVAGATGAFAWTNSAAISCHSSTGWQIGITARTSGVRYDTVADAGGATAIYVGPMASNSAVTDRTGISDATSVSVSAGTVYSASRSCTT